MVRGSYALAVLFKDFPDTIFAVKKESPLIVGWGEGENFVARISRPCSSTPGTTACWKKATWLS